MRPLEKQLLSLRHHPALKKTDWIWNCLRPCYDAVLALVAFKGMERVMNGTDKIFLHPQSRHTLETYEPNVWKHVMGEIRSGDVVVDVGANIGLYTIALAKRVGPEGTVIAFEPDSDNFHALRKNVKLNQIEHQVQLIRAAVGDFPGEVSLSKAQMESHVLSDAAQGSERVPMVTLDDVCKQKIDILKIDIEGYEEKALLGASRLLEDSERSPRCIYLEVHPFAWPSVGTTSESLLTLLEKLGYQAEYIDGGIVHRIDYWGEIIARKNDKN